MDDTNSRDQSQYIAQLEDALNAFDGALIATMIMAPQYAKSLAQFRDQHAEVLARAIPAALARKEIKNED